MLIYRKRGKVAGPAAKPPVVATPARQVLQKRKPGRPKGSKNKPKGS